LGNALISLLDTECSTGKQQTMAFTVDFAADHDYVHLPLCVPVSLVSMHLLRRSDNLNRSCLVLCALLSPCTTEV